jgi:hypothetical protein
MPLGLVLALFLVAIAAESPLLTGEIAALGQLRSVYASENGVFVLSLSQTSYYISWATPGGISVLCDVWDALPPDATLMHVVVNANTLFVLFAVDTKVSLLTFHITGSSCTTFDQWSHTPKGNPIYAFLLFLGPDVVVGLSDTTREFFLTTFLPSLTGTSRPNPKWSQARSLTVADTAALDKTGTLTKAVPDHTHDTVREAVIYLDKTGKSTISFVLF